MVKEVKETKNCDGKKKVMLSFGIIQLSSRFISALALIVIALGLCTVKKEAKLFTECVEEIIEGGSSKSNAVRYCNGG